MTLKKKKYKRQFSRRRYMQFVRRDKSCPGLKVPPSSSVVLFQLCKSMKLEMMSVRGDVGVGGE